MEEYSRTPEGALYTYDWTIPEKLAHVTGGQTTFKCPMHEEPLHLIPPEWREHALVRARPQRRRASRTVHIEGDLCPSCRQIFRELMAEYDGDWAQVMKHVRVRRLILSEQDRVGIGTFQPKDEKNQDSTELTGDINYRKIAEYGSDSDPRAFNFDGEFNIANRGIIEFIEVLKLDVAFLYDLLGRVAGAQDQAEEVRPDRHRRGDPRPHQRARVQEAAVQRVHGGAARPHGQDRHPVHHARLRRAVEIYEKDYNAGKIRGKHIAPHTLEMAAMWAVLTRLEEPKKRQPDAAAEAEALRRQDAARLHRGQHQGAAQGGGARGDGRHQPALHPGQDLERPGQRTAAKGASTRSWS